MSFFGYDISGLFGIVPTTVKSIINLPSAFKFDHDEEFLRADNIETLVYCVYNKNVENGNDVKIDQFRKLIPGLAKKWARTQNLEDYEVLGPDPLTDFLRIANRNFFEDHEYLFAIKPFQESNPVRGTRGGKAPKDMMFEDLKNADYAVPNDIIVTDKVMRYGNKYPINQIPPPRHLDLRNEGLRNYFADDASKPNIQQTFDMSGIYRRTEEAHDAEYRDFPWPYDSPGVERDF